ncbi:MAG: PorV/PorQ family protein [Ignavibacteriae bacterium]|nr:PorV/PorQ family protein [Ignavibacteriota bacterium]
MNKIIFLILILTFSAAESNAQLFPTLGGQRAGISTAQFLKIGVGGRATAMGDAYIAVANDVSSLYWNPAGLVQSDKDQIMFSHNNWIVDIGHEFLGANYHISNNDVVGFSLMSLHMKDMKVTTEVNPFGTGEYFSFGDFSVSASYSRRMTEQFSFGATIRYIEETLDKLKMRGVLVDLGTFYWTGLGSTRFAVTISNFGNELAPDGKVILFGGREKSEWQSFSPPTMFRIGFALEPYQNEDHRITASIQLNHPNDNSENVSIGSEYSWHEMFFVRGGYKINSDEQDLSFGVGVKMDLDFSEFTLDYSFVNFERLGSAHRFSIILGI